MKRSTLPPTRTRCHGSCSGHPDAQDFGRKFKPAFTAARNMPAASPSMHDMGVIAVNAYRERQK